MKFNRIHKKFVEKFQHLNSVFVDGVFTDPETEKLFQVFRTGYMSHPSYCDKYVMVVGHITETGVEFALNPQLHSVFNKAKKECERLRKKHGGEFMSFVTVRDSDNLHKLAIKGLARFKKSKNTKPEIAFPGSKLVDGKIPEHTVCPFREKCEIAISGNCNHNGVEHTVSFSCASARGFDLLGDK